MKRILSFSSGVLKRFWTAVAACLAWAMGCALLLDAAAGRDDLLAGAGADLEATHRHRAARSRRSPAPSPDPCSRLIRPASRSARASSRRSSSMRDRRDARPGLLAERIGEAALRQATRDRHLAAFEVRLAAARAVVARARLDTLVTLARRLAGAGSRTAAETLAVRDASPARA